MYICSLHVEYAVQVLCVHLLTFTYVCFCACICACVHAVCVVVVQQGTLLISQSHLCMLVYTR